MAIDDWYYPESKRLFNERNTIDEQSYEMLNRVRKAVSASSARERNKKESETIMPKTETGGAPNKTFDIDAITRAAREKAQEAEEKSRNFGSCTRED